MDCICQWKIPIFITCLTFVLFLGAIRLRQHSSPLPYAEKSFETKISNHYNNNSPQEGVMQFLNEGPPQPEMVEFDPPDIFYVKIQKTGSTSFKMMLSHIAQEYDRYFSHKKIFLVTEGQWRNRIHHFPQHKLQIFAGHIFFKPFMLKDQFWLQGKRPFFVTLLRKPFDQFFSQFRYRVDNCRFHSNNEIDQKACRFGTDFEAFSRYFCEDQEGKLELFCNEETKFTAGDLISPLDIILQYDMVLILERFGESLALLHALYGLPMRFLFELKLNHNTHVHENIISVSDDLKYDLEHRYLMDDQNLYQVAWQVLDQKIQSLTPFQQERFRSHLEKQALFQHECERACGGYNDARTSPACKVCVAKIL